MIRILMEAKERQKQGNPLDFGREDQGDAWW